jgi:histidinol-phosphatase (PHP family)
MLDLEKLEPLQTNGLTDYHCHCDYSIDAVGTIDEYCQAALRLGLVEICFTTHWDTSTKGSTDDNVIRIDGELKPNVPDNLEPYVADVRRAGDKFFSLGLQVKLGLEYGWYRGCEESAAALKQRYDFDYFLCGLHELEGACFSCPNCHPQCFAKYSVEELVEGYTGELVAAAESGLFDCIAHIDYLRKYAHKHYGDKLDQLLFERGLPPIIDALKQSNTKLEINTGALRRGFSDYFPSMKIINAVKRAGIEIPYLGSDAHAPDQVGLDFDAASVLVSPWSEEWSED